MGTIKRGAEKKVAEKKKKTKKPVVISSMWGYNIHACIMAYSMKYKNNTNIMIDLTIMVCTYMGIYRVLYSRWHQPCENRDLSKKFVFSRHCRFTTQARQGIVKLLAPLVPTNTTLIGILPDQVILGANSFKDKHCFEDDPPQ